MLSAFSTNQMQVANDAMPKLALRAYLAGLGAAASLIVGATVLVSLGFELAFG